MSVKRKAEDQRESQEERRARRPARLEEFKGDLSKRSQSETEGEVKPKHDGTEGEASPEEGYGKSKAWPRSEDAQAKEDMECSLPG